MAELEELGYRVLAISPDMPKYAGESKGAHELAFTFASDGKLDAARAFRVAFDMGDELFNTYKNKYNLDLAERSGAEHTWLPVPAVFIIGKSGRVDFQYVNPLYQVRLHPDVLMAAARAAVQ